MPIDLKIQAIALRRKGLFYSEIADKLGVAKSTVHLWTHSLKLSRKELEMLRKKQLQLKQEQVKKLNTAKLQKQARFQASIEAEALLTVGQAELEPAHKKLLCAVLFWCEGGKDVGSGIRFINSDPFMIQKFLTLLRESFDIDEGKLRALIHLHSYHDPETQLRYWSEVAKIPQSQFYKPYRKPNTGKNTREGYPGCVSIRYPDASLAKLLKAIFIEFGKNGV